MGAKADYLAWRKQAAIGCVFARMIARRPRYFGQAVEEIASKGSPPRIAAAIAKRVDILLADRTVSAAALLLPDITSLKRLSMVILELRAHSSWSVTTSALHHPPVGDFVAFHVNRKIPFGSTTCPSEALVLGPFSEFPPTRQSPVTAFEVYLSEPLSQDPKTHKPTTKANLAHMDLSESDLDPQQIDAMWHMSEQGRLRSLGGAEDSRAKAKVSFVIPVVLAHELGCVP